MKYDIRMESAGEELGSYALLKNEIAGAETYLHRMGAGEEITLEEDGAAHIFILSAGAITVGGLSLAGRGIAAFSPMELSLCAEAESLVFEISWALTEAERSALKPVRYSLNYDDARRYTEDCKSEKTISRTLLKEQTLPRIAIGSVETYGDDRIANHEHPYVDQLFFSFPENDMQVVIGDEAVPMGGDALIHIPLASSHGVELHGEQCAHYVWIDFIIDEERGLEFLATAHHEI